MTSYHTLQLGIPLFFDATYRRRQKRCKAKCLFVTIVYLVEQYAMTVNEISESPTWDLRMVRLVQDDGKLDMQPVMSLKFDGRT